MVLATGSWLTVERVRRVAAICGLGSIAFLLWLAVTSTGTLDWRGRPLGTDFSDVWSAGKMVLSDRPTDVWVWSKHFAVQRAIHGSHLTELYAWHYPPPFLLVASLVAFLPYVPALISWQLITLIPFLFAMQRIVPGRDTLLLTPAAPVTLLCLFQGQNGSLTAGLMTVGLILIDRRPIISGIVLGYLVYKPQFALILPFALVAGRHWRVIVGAILSSSCLIGITLLLWGWPVWHAFIDSLPVTRTLVIENGQAGFYKIMSPFAATRMWGGSVPIAYGVQFAATALAIAAVTALSLNPARPHLRNAVVCAASIVATPYVLDYDLVLLLPALAWLYIDGQLNGFRTWDASVMAAVWIAPLFAHAAAQILYVPLGMLSATAVVIVALRRALGGDPVPVGHIHASREQQIRQP